MAAAPALVLALIPALPPVPAASCFIPKTQVHPRRALCRAPGCMVWLIDSILPFLSLGSAPDHLQVLYKRVCEYLELETRVEVGTVAPHVGLCKHGHDFNSSCTCLGIAYAAISASPSSLSLEAE